MKVTLDLGQLLRDGEITQEEHDKLKALAAKSTGSLAFNILIGFGVIAVAGSALALVPAPATGLLIGALTLGGGIALLLSGRREWVVLSNICILVGALMAGGGIIALAEGGVPALITVAVLFGAAAVFAKSTLLSVLSTLAFSGALGAGTYYGHASYFLVISEPASTVLVFSVVGALLFELSKRLDPDYERLAIAASRTSAFLVNFGFWVGSLWGERSREREVVIADWVFSIAWAIALIAAGIWAWKRNRRWLLNTVATFGAIHFYTQWFETLGASPFSILLAGLLALGFALGLSRMNAKMKDSSTVPAAR